MKRAEENLSTASIRSDSEVKEVRKGTLKTMSGILANAVVMAVMAPIYLGTYLYEKLLNYLWPDPNDHDDDSDLMED